MIYFSTDQTIKLLRVGRIYFFKNNQFKKEDKTGHFHLLIYIDKEEGVYGFSPITSQKKTINYLIEIGEIKEELAVFLSKNDYDKLLKEFSGINCLKVFRFSKDEMIKIVDSANWNNSKQFDLKLSHLKQVVDSIEMNDVMTPYEKKIISISVPSSILD